MGSPTNKCELVLILLVRNFIVTSEVVSEAFCCNQWGSWTVRLNGVTFIVVFSLLGFSTQTYVLCVVIWFMSSESWFILMYVLVLMILSIEILNELKVKVIDHWTSPPPPLSGSGYSNTLMFGVLFQLLHYAMFFSIFEVYEMRCN